MNEDVMWERLKDVQREVETSRLHQALSWPELGSAARLLGGRAWLVARRATRRAPRRTDRRLA